jgi:hypothetical protein
MVSMMMLLLVPVNHVTIHVKLVLKVLITVLFVLKDIISLVLPVSTHVQMDIILILILVTVNNVIHLVKPVTLVKVHRPENVHSVHVNAIAYMVNNVTLLKICVNMKEPSVLLISKLSNLVLLTVALVQMVLI